MLNKHTSLSANLKLVLVFLVPTLSYLVLTFFSDAFKEYNKNIFIGDQQTYFQAADDFYNHFRAHAYRCIGYPLFLGLPELIGLKPPYSYWPVILNFIFFIGILTLLLKIEKLIEINLALPVAFILSFCSGFIRSINLALTEIGFAFFLVFGLYSLLKLMYSNCKIRYSFLFVFSLGMATLFRPGFYILTLIIACISIIIIMFKKKSIGTAFYIQKSILAVVSALVITLGAQSILMKKTFNSYRLTYIDDSTWFYYIGALSTTIYENDCFTNECFRAEGIKRNLILSDKTLDEMSVIAKADRKKIILTQKKALFKAYKINVVSNFITAAGWDEKENKLMYKLAVITNILLSFFPFLLYLIILLSKLRCVISKEMHVVFNFVLCVIAYTVLTSGISCYQGDRFHIVFYPLALIFIVFILKKCFPVKQLKGLKAQLHNNEEF